MKISLKEIDGTYPDVEIEFEDKGVDLVRGVYVAEFRFNGKSYLSDSMSADGGRRFENDKIIIKKIVEENNLSAINDMVSDMETIKAFLGLNGRFVGDEVNVPIKDLANCIRTFKQTHA